MKKVFLLIVFALSFFITGCGEENTKDCHHYIGSDYWDDPRYSCWGSRDKESQRYAESQKQLEERCRDCPENRIK